MNWVFCSTNCISLPHAYFILGASPDGLDWSQNVCFGCSPCDCSLCGACWCGLYPNWLIPCSMNDTHSNREPPSCHCTCYQHCTQPYFAEMVSGSACVAMALLPDCGSWLCSFSHYLQVGSVRICSTSMLASNLPLFLFPVYLHVSMYSRLLHCLLCKTVLFLILRVHCLITRRTLLVYLYIRM